MPEKVKKLETINWTNGKTEEVLEPSKKELKNTLTEELRTKILAELDKPWFPDLNFLYSEEVLDVALDLLRELLNEEKEIFEKILKTPNEQITFDLFEEETKLNYFWKLLEHLQSVYKWDKIDKIIEEFEPEYIDFWNDAAYNKSYYEMQVYCLENCNLDEEQKRILEKRIENFKLRWIDLSKEKQEKLKEISKRLAKLEQDFRSNIVKDQANWSYNITDFDAIKNIPEATLEIAKERAKEKWIDGYVFTADPNEYSHILDYCSNSSIRKNFYQVYNSFSSSWKYDNRPLILEILKLKEEKAKILGYKNYGELSLVDKMAESPEQVKEFIESIFQKAKIKTENEFSMLREYFGLDTIEPWDVYYYSELYKKEKYNIDNNKVKEYFELDNVLDYLHSLVKKLYNVELKPLEIETYSEDVKAYEVYKNGDLISYFFLDPFSRKEKNIGAWADTLREKTKNNMIPIVSNVCNFQKVWKWKNLLAIDDLITMFHEFGHALHEILSESKYAELSWFNIEYDAVELPSQLHENWITERESFEKLPKHYETWDSLPEEILSKLDELKTYMKWFYITRQNEFALLDMYLHADKAPENIEELDRKVLDLVNRFWVFNRDEKYKMYCTFKHIFASWYDAWYYSYMWADIMVADIWEKIKKEGIFNSEIVKKFEKTILSQWSKKPARELFKDFMWRDVNPGAFMKTNGLEE